MSAESYSLIATCYFIGPMHEIEHSTGKQYLFPCTAFDSIFLPNGKEIPVVTNCWFIFEGGFVDVPVKMLQWGDRLVIKAYIRRSEIAEIMLHEPNGLYVTSVSLTSRGSTTFSGTKHPLPLIVDLPPRRD